MVMKKWGIIALIILIIVTLGIVAGIAISNGDTSNSNPSGSKTLAHSNQLTNTTQVNEILIATNATQVKTTPNTKIQLKRSYLDCGHTTTDKLDMPSELVNLTQEEFLKQYGDDWKVEKFEAEEIILSKREIGICKEHYIIKEKEGYIAVYSLDKYGVETLKETTSISTQYLPPVDLEKIREGIKVNGKQALNATLEDYE